MLNNAALTLSTQVHIQDLISCQQICLTLKLISRASLRISSHTSHSSHNHTSRKHRQGTCTSQEANPRHRRNTSADYVNHIRNTVCVIGSAQSSALINLKSVATGRSVMRIHPPCHPPSHNGRPETARAAALRHTTTFVSLLGYPVPPPTTSPGTKF